MKTNNVIQAAHLFRPKEYLVETLIANILYVNIQSALHSIPRHYDFKVDTEELTKRRQVDQDIWKECVITKGFERACIHMELLAEWFDNKEIK